MTSRTPDALLLITRRWWRIRRRWHWEVVNLWVARWPDGEGYADTWEEARTAGHLRIRLGPGGPLPQGPNPTQWTGPPPTLSILPYSNPASQREAL